MPDHPLPATWPRWLRLSVRGLIVLVLIVGGWLGWVVRHAQIQREALNALDEAINGELECGWEFPNGATTRDSCSGPRWLVDSIGIDYFGRITSLGFWESPADEDLIHVARLGSVEDLGLGGAWRITDSGLRHLAGLTNLRWLYLAKTQVSDAGLVYLKNLSSLEELDLSETRITDDGLVHLEGLVSLRELDISNTDVTAAGVGKLQEAMPALKIRALRV